MRKALLLQEMGITRWQLRRPEIFKGYATMYVPSHVRLLMITTQKIDPSSIPLFQDILRACQLTSEQVMWLEKSQLNRLKTHAKLIYCCWGEMPELKTLSSENSWQLPEISQFCQSPTAKRDLWKKIQQFLNATLE
ncbi:hypothetical protein CEP48_04145 [Mergibacter septicus]|uniref:DNA polymerase III subunit psi n=1 Tax=Mergibacter septicus TaxID=221402 RepID=A0A8D4LK07_9PAST|nr:DNA polymerase III subunit psi [Mergibacter septicus]AWX15410.1 hypothetical protein CEP47_04150 [Mergibacter septicus]QDJ12889.1 hypothetical protein CEP45_03070 [Mergibacter septicus]QDJ14663.1 hypothetical protein CEP48_04145 [Mergibacter septicus]UTU47905.1 DNA polymerase III subunit psi [Mergibacter septicus]WMR96489.1 DNA polymerase III subunit psi [Mergibacter septicus]